MQPLHSIDSGDVHPAISIAWPRTPTDDEVDGHQQDEADDSNFSFTDMRSEPIERTVDGTGESCV